MADAYLEMTYKLQLSDRDMRIVCLALAKKIDNAKDAEAAKELNIRLLRAQAIRISEQKQKIDGALERALAENCNQCGGSGFLPSGPNEEDEDMPCPECNVS